VDKGGENGDDGLQCLECGAILPAGIDSCPTCGNEKNLMAARWSPPGDVSSVDPVPGQGMARDTRLLVGLTLALFCALIFLGSARARTEAMLNGESPDELTVVSAGYGQSNDEPAVEEVSVSPEPVEDTDDIDTLRLQAQVSDVNGDYTGSADVWKEVLAHPEAGLSDFLSLAKAQENDGDLIGSGETLTRACNRYPDSPDVYLALGGLRERQENPEAARFQYQVGVSYCPDNEELRTRLEEIVRVPADETEIWPPDWLNDPEVPEVEIPVPVEEPETIVLYEPHTEDEVVSMDHEPVRIFIEPEETTPEGDNDNREPERSGLITLIGGAEEVEAEPEPENEDEPLVSEAEETDETEPLEIRDIRITASETRVVIEVHTSRPAIFSTSRGTDAPRLFVRVPGAIIPEGAPVSRNININVPIVERISVVENSDTNSYVSLVVYLDPAARHSVAAVGQTLQITIARAPETEDEGLEQ